MNKKSLFLALLAVILVFSASIGNALAYFTAYTTAEGRKTLTLLPRTTIEEPTANEKKKEIVIANTGNAPCFVRVKAFAGSDIVMNVTAGNGWTDGDGSDYWYFTPVLMPGASTNKLEIALSNIPEAAENGDSFNIVVVYESVPAIYDSSNDSYVADWTRDVHVVEEDGGQ